VDGGRKISSDSNFSPVLRTISCHDVTQQRDKGQSAEMTTNSHSAIMNSNRSEARHAVRIMLHAEDGMIPYLTPDVLEQCFPPDAIWCLGMAVNDTCIVPIYKPDLQKQRNATKSKNEQEIQSTAKNGGPKPRGYTFAVKGWNQLDSWLYPYLRIALPSFDNRATSSTSKPMGDMSTPSTAPVKKSLALWTANGRHNIDSQQYIECAIVGLRAHQVLSLHEPLDAWSLSLKYKNHKLAVLQQNQFWIQEHKRLLVQRPSVDTFWFPLAVAVDTDFINNPIDQKHLDWIGDQQSWLSSSSCPKVVPDDIQYGIMLIGWNSITSIRSRSRILQTLQEELEEMAVSALAVGTISTSTTRQILEWLQFSVGQWLQRSESPTDDEARGISRCNSILIGTNLPAAWARAKRCFAVDIETAPANQVHPLKLDEDGCWNLNRPIMVDGSCQPVNEHPFYFDQRPLVSKCTCWTCTTYSRAYLYHLICAKELLAEVLLFIHNFHHLLSLARTVNVHHQEGDADKIIQLCHRVQSQLEPLEAEVVALIPH
jgi:Queuine tRNA-ribosyltransferase